MVRQIEVQRRDRHRIALDRCKVAVGPRIDDLAMKLEPEIGKPSRIDAIVGANPKLVRTPCRVTRKPVT